MCRPSPSDYPSPCAQAARARSRGWQPSAAAQWHGKLAFYETGNGDLIAFDLAEDRYGQVVYLSHDDGEGHGYVLARDFRDLLARWLPLGCTGGEDWQWLPFTAGPDSGFEPYAEPAMTWRRFLGIDAVWEPEAKAFRSRTRPLFHVGPPAGGRPGRRGCTAPAPHGRSWPTSSENRTVHRRGR